MKLIVLLLPIFLYGCSSVLEEYPQPRIRSNSNELKEAISKGYIPGGVHNNDDWRYYKKHPDMKKYN
jgi:hypothetical protein